MSEPARASAPAKLVLIGEYAVLEGGRALVAAVDRRAKGELVGEKSTEDSEVVKAVITRARRSGYEAAPKRISIDTSQFFDRSGEKLGLGSSAAVAVVAAALLTGSGDEGTLAIAVDAHREAAGGEGSGVDVAASFYGGVIASRRQPSPVVPLPSHCGTLTLSVLFTGKGASTKEMIARCRASAKFDQWMSVMRGIADEGVHAWSEQDAHAFLSAIARYGRAMDGMGRDAGTPIVDERTAAIMRLADEHRAAAKPSGAGGGDVVLVAATDADIAGKIGEKVGMQRLDLSIDRRGLSRR